MSDLIIETLKDGLDPSVLAHLQSNPELTSHVSKYFADLFVNDQLLSTESFTSNSQGGEKTLTEEIAELDSQQRQIDVQLAALANQNREPVIECSRSLNLASDHLEQDIGSRLGEIAAEAGAWRLRGRQPRERARDQVFFSIDAILDVLELPTLCKICVLQGNYQEALEIHTLVKMLCIKFPSQRTFSHIEQRVRAELSNMCRGLVKLLNTNLKQSNILKIFQILNRPDLGDFGAGAAVSPAVRAKSLQILYLNSRFRFITGEVATLKPLLKLRKLTYLKRYIEVYREYLFNSLSIYYAIFRTGAEADHASNDRLLIHSYLRNLVGLLVSEMKAHLPSDLADADTRGQRDGVLLQSVYLCKSLEKYGFDFEPVLAWELCVQDPVVSQDDWARTLSKVQKFRA